VSPRWAAAIAELARRAGGDTVVDMGAGGGELASALSVLLPDRHVVAVDLAAAPAGLPVAVQWRHELPASYDGLLVASEWLDNVPVDVVELTEDGPRYVEVSTDGAERLGEAVAGADAAWLDRWWPLAEPGDRAEVGRPRDEAWRDAVRRLARGVAVAIDYGADPLRDVAGTLTGYRHGRQVAAVPDGSCDVTAHVLMESCAAAVEDAETLVLTQREALRRLGVSGSRPSYGSDARAYLRALGAAGDDAELLDPNGLGAFTWLVHARGVPLPL
jgi:SAM-dependent MidA family methyltransferase